jgi:hypothetical protein
LALALWPNERLFFEIYGQALQGRPGTTELLDGIVDDWLEPGIEYGLARGMTRASRRPRARVSVSPSPAGCCSIGRSSPVFESAGSAST